MLRNYNIIFKVNIFNIQQGYSGDDCSIKPVVVKELPKQNRKFEVNQEQVIEKVEPKEIVYSLNNTIFRKTNDCKDKCNNKGNCLNNICFCKQGFTGETCEKEYKDILKAGFKFTDTIKYLIMAAGGGLVLGIIFSCLSS